MAAFCISSGVVPMATVNTLGTLTRMFSVDSAAQRDLDLHRLQAQPGVVLDQRHDERAPPWIDLAAWPARPVLPKITSTRLLGQRLYCFISSISIVKQRMASSTKPPTTTVGQLSANNSVWVIGVSPVVFRLRVRCSGVGFGSDRLRERLHFQRTRTDHANYDNFSTCGQLCRRGADRFVFQEPVL